MSTTGDEIRSTPAEFSATRLDATESAVEAIGRTVADRGDEVTYEFLADGDGTGSTLTIRELDRRARAVAAALAQRARPGTRVLLLYPPGEHFVTGFLGTLYAGMVAVPVYPPDPARLDRTLPRLRAIARGSNAAIVLSTRLLHGFADALFDQAGELGALPWLVTEDAVLTADDGWRPPALDRDSVALLQYTSGSTGTPRGVVVTHGNLLSNGRAIARDFGLDGHEVNVSWLPFYHDMGLLGGVLQPLLSGVSTILMSPLEFMRRPMRWLETIAARGGSVSGGPNFAYDLCVGKSTEAERAALDLSGWRVAFCGAEPVRHRTLARFTEAFAVSGFDPSALLPCYGLAEATLFVAGSGRGRGARSLRVDRRELERRAVVPRADGDHVVSSGNIASGHEVAVVDGRTGTPVRDGGVGELWVSGPSVAAGYWDDPDATAAVFGARLPGDPKPYLRTGDLGFVHDGHLYVTGRVKELVVVRGRNLYPHDLEESAVRASRRARPGCGAVFSVETPDGEQCVLLQEVTAGTADDELPEVAEAIASAVSGEHGVSLVDVVLLAPRSLPKTSSGKVQRLACQAAYRSGPVDGERYRRRGAAAAPQLPGQSLPSRAELLALPDEQRIDALVRGLAAGRQDAVLVSELDLDSLAAVELAFTLEERLGVDVDLAVLLRPSSLRDLAVEIDARLRAAPAPDAGSAHPEPGHPEPGHPEPEDADPEYADRGAVPLSAGQQSLLLMREMETSGSRQNVSLAVRLADPLDVVALAGAVRLLGTRHPILTTRFGTDGTGHWQRADPDRRFELETVDLAGASEAELRARVDDRALTPLDVERGEVARATLVTGVGSPVLVLAQHHLITDFWSVVTLLDELAALYGHLVRGRDPHLPPAVGHPEFVRWQQEYERSPRWQRDERYWLDLLSGDVRAPNLPYQEGAEPESRIASTRVPVPARVVAELDRVADECGTTQFSVLMAVFQRLIGAHSGDAEFVVGTTTTGRPGARFRNTLGYLSNVIPVRADLVSPTTVGELISRTGQQVRDSLGHQHFPYRRLVEVLRARTNGAPVINAAVVHERSHRAFAEDVASVVFGTGAPSAAFGDLALEPFPVRELPATQFDITLHVVPAGDGLLAHMLVRADRFPAGFADRLAEQYLDLLGQVAPRLAAPVSALRLTGAADSLGRADVPARVQAGVTSVVDLFQESVERAPDAVAIVAGDLELSYAEVDRAANRFGHALRGRGIGPEDTVGLCLPRSPELVIAMLAVLKAGAAFVPLDPDLPRARLADMVDDARCARVVCVAETAELAAGLGAVVRFDEPGTEAHPDGRPETAVGGSNLAYVIFTSGSTGRPKGAQVEHRSLVSFVLSFRDVVAIGPGDRVLQFAPLTFDACIEEIFATWSAGAALVLRDKAVVESAERFLAWCGEQRLTLVDLPTAFFHVLVSALDGGATVPPTLRTVLIAGEALHPDKLASWFAADRGHVDLFNRWGTTEATVCSTFALLRPTAGRPRLASDIPVGRDMTDAVVHVLDAAWQPVPDGVVGEAYIGGVGVGRGYASAARTTAQRFVPDPFTTEPGRRLYATGDLVRRAGDGELRYVGRADQQVKVRGYRIELGELDVALRRHPAVVEAAAVVTREAGETELIGAVTGQVEVEDLRDWLHRELPSYMVPSRLLVLDRVPLTANGKVDAAALRALARSAAASSEVADLSPTEQRLTAIWRAVLDVDGVGPDDEFFSLGGHSLRVAALNTRVRAEFGVAPPLRMFFEAVTVRAQAARVDELLAAERSGAVGATPAAAPVEPHLSLGQRRLWFLDRLAQDAGAYLVSGVLRVYGELDRDALRGALDDVVARHPALRTGFRDEAGRPVPFVVAGAGCPFEVVDRTHVPPAGREPALADLAAGYAGRTFALDGPPLLRAALVEFGPDEHALLLSVHHIVFDGRSLAVVATELGELYRARVTGGTADLPAPAADYFRWAREESALLGSEAGRRGLAFWQRHLADAPHGLELPVDRPRPAIQTFRGARVPLALSAEDSALLREVAGRQRATVFMALAACLASTLSRLSGQDRVVIGLPDANRPADGTHDDAVGFYVNTVPLCLEVSPGDTATALLDRVRASTVEAMAWRWVPFSAVVEAVVQDRDPSRSPVFQVILDVHSGGLPSPDLAGLRVETGALFAGSAKTDLTFEITDDGGPLTGWLEYNSDLFTPATARQISRTFGETSRALARRPDDLIAVPGAHATLDHWPTEVAPAEVPDTFWSRFEQVTAGAPDAIAVEDDDRAVTYGELRRQVEQVARVVSREYGTGRGDVVAVEIASSVEAVVAVLAVQRCGAAYVPVDPDYPAERRTFMRVDSGARTVLTAETVRRALDQPPLDDPLPPVEPDAAAYLMYTSGSTGRPKGALVSHRNLATSAGVHARCFGIDDRTRLLQFASMSFDGSVWEIFSTLASGATLCLIARRHALVGAALADALVTRDITVCLLPPSVIASLPDRPLPRLATLVSAGEPCRADQVARWQPGRRFLNGYGPTECTIMITVDECVAGQPISLGRVLPGGDVRVLDADLRPAVTGAIGEVYVAGAGVGIGYHDRPALTAQRYLPDPFSDVPGARMYRTGDLVRVRADGVVEYCGRQDNQLKLRGYRVEPEEIEAVLLAVDGVTDASARRVDAVLVAYVEARDPVPTADELERLCAEALPSYMVPAAFVVQSELPRLPNGKLDASRLARPRRNDFVDTAPLPLESAAERAVARVWADVLDVDAVGGADNFFALGGHSLLATVVTARMSAELGRDVPLRTLFEAPVLRDYAALTTGGALREATGGIAAHGGDGRSAPLSVMQERLWILEELDRGAGQDALHGRYHLAGAIRLTGALDEDGLRRAVARLVERHAALRTVVVDEDGELSQRVLDHVDIALPRETPAGATPEERVAEAHELVARDATTPVDLAAGPLLRLRLLDLDRDDAVLVMTLHHIVGDGWSLEILKRDLAHHYAEEVGEPPAEPLPPLPVTYAQFSGWQRHQLGTGALDGSVAYWRDQLADLPPLGLPGSRRGAEPAAAHGNRRRAIIDAPLRSGIERLAVESGATPFMVLAAALQVTLGRLAGQRDFAIGVPVAGRQRHEVAELIGFFVNSLVLRADLSGNPSFTGLLERVRATTLDAYEHQDVPFETLVGELAPERDLTTTPLFQVYLNLVNIPPLRSDLPGLSVAPFAVPELGAKFDLTFYVEPDGPRMSVDLVYAVDRFDAEAMDELLAQWIGVLDQAVADRERPIDSLRLRTPLAERLLPDPTAPLDATWFGSVVERFEDWAEREPQRLAITEPGQDLGYGELASGISALAAVLAEHGIGRGDVVAVHGERCAALVWSLLAVMRAGASFAVLDPAYPAARLVDCLAVAEPTALLCLDAAGPVPTEVLDALGDRPQIAVPTRLSDARDAPAPVPAVAVGPRDCAYIAFTSGSTGRPKGIRGSHGSLTHFVPWLAETFGLTEDDRYSLLSGIGHDPLHREVFTPLCTGAAICVPAREDVEVPRRLAAWLRDQRVSTGHLTPPMARLLDEVPAADVTLPSLRRVFFTGDALTRRDVRAVTRLAGPVTCVNLYGSTESQRAVGYFVVPDAGGDHSGAERDGGTGQDGGAAYPLGRGVEDVQLLVVTEAGDRAGIGEPGEIVIRSPHLALGYAGDDELTAARFGRNPFASGDDEHDRVYRTGDRGRYALDGTVLSLGRADNQVKIRGHRVETDEVLHVVRAAPTVRDALVVARPGPDGETALVAYVVHDGEGMSGEELRAFVRTRLPQHMVPAHVVALASFPLTPNRKIDRAALPEPSATPASGGEPLPALSATEELVAGIWREVLGVTRVLPEDNFFGLGGHSLVATRVVSRIGRALGVELGLRALFEQQTVRGLAAHLDGLAARAEVADPITRQPTGAVLPASYGQERLWILNQLEGDTHAYNTATAVRLRGSLDTAALTAALDDLVRRHEVLRTGLVLVDGSVRQVIEDADEVTLPLDVVDLGEEPADTVEQTWRRRVDDAAAVRFDLAAAPLERATLIRLAADDHVFVLVAHHVVADAWGMQVLVRDFAAFYRARREQVPGPGPAPLSVRYADWSSWQRTRFERGDYRAQLDHWLAELGEPAELLEFPDQRPRPATMSNRGLSVRRTIPRELVERVRRVGREHGGTLFMTLLAAFNCQLHRYSGAADIAVGVPVSTRSVVETEDVVGFFVNTIVCRNRLSGSDTFVQLLDRVRANALAAFANQDVPFDRVIEALQPDRDLSRNPLFQVMFVLHNAPVSEIDLGEVTLEHQYASTGTAKFDLSLDLAEEPSGLHATLELNADLFDAVTGERLLDHFETLLAHIAEAPGLALADLELRPPAELAAQAALGTGPEPFTSPTPAAALELRAALTPDAPAVVDGDRTWSHRELRDLVAGIAERLDAAIAEGELPAEPAVVVCARRSVRHIAAAIACGAVGATYVPVSPAFPDRRISAVLDRLGDAVLVTDDERAERLAALAGGRPQVLLDGVGAGTRPLDGRRPNPRERAYVIFTSGTTGKPKGVEVEQAGLLNHLELMAHDLDLTRADVVAQTAPQSFDISIWQMLVAVLRGATTVVSDDDTSRDAASLLELVRTRGVTVLQLVPGVVQALLELALPDDLRSVRYLIATGEELPPGLCARWLRRFPDIPVVNAYGPAECSDDTHLAVLSTPPPTDRPVPIGRPVAGVRSHVVDRDGRVLPLGVAGELVIGGIAVGRGYAGDPRATAERFVPDPYSDRPGARLYRTGDRARLTGDGALEFLGRFDDQLKIRGFRIEAGEVESALRAVDGVSEAVVAVRTADGEPLLVACVAGTVRDPAALSDQLSARLLRYMVPGGYVFVDRLPRTPNGKIDRGALNRDDLVIERVRREYAEPETPVERLVASVFGELLDCGPVGTLDDFFRLGGHSLLATRLVAELAARTDVELPLRAVFDDPTVRGVAAALESLQWAGLSEAERLELHSLLDELTDDEARVMLAADNEGNG
ncbi:amino acid adenylation domain-containing protein [Saccharothrix sp. BKS2]|uniref:amino acid adenylation domain-containing protein n=1 Tax=Saccharothrix sp. BKS2 TaxID=3064400 RepID=UPI0039EC1E34